MKRTIILCSIISCLAGCSDDPAEPGVEQADVLLLEDAHFPSWSPDGSQVICNRSIGGLNSLAWKISRSGGSSDTLFVGVDLADGPMFPKWMPNGEDVIYLGQFLNDEQDFFMIRHVVQENSHPLSTSPKRKNKIDTPPVRPTKLIMVDDLWTDPGFTLTPDGSEVFYTSWREESGHVVMAINLSNRSTRLIGVGVQAAVSPDGQWIAIAREDSLAIVPADGGEEITMEPGYWPTWTTDSQYVIFSGIGQESGNSELVMINRDGTYREELTDDPEKDLCPMVSPLGRELVYVKTPHLDWGPFQVRRLKLNSPAHGGY